MTEKAIYWRERIQKVLPLLPKNLTEVVRNTPNDFDKITLMRRINNVRYKYYQDAPIVEFLEQIANQHKAQ